MVDSLKLLLISWILRYYDKDLQCKISVTFYKYFELSEKSIPEDEFPQIQILQNF